MTVFEKLQAGLYDNKLEWPSRKADDARQKVDAYNDETNRLEAQFRDDAFRELEIADHPKAQKAYGLAWEYGHSAGYAEVFHHLQDLACLIRD